MKTHRILGILWLALCGYSAFNLFRGLLEIHPDAPGLWVALVWLGISCLLYLAGMTAAIFLFRGARWARWVIAPVAIFMALTTIAYIVALKSFPIWAVIFVVISVVSLPLLFLPRHEPVA